MFTKNDERLKMTNALTIDHIRQKQVLIRQYDDVILVRVRLLDATSKLSVLLARSLVLVCVCIYVF
jgi:hypothetical protein